MYQICMPIRLLNLADTKFIKLKQPTMLKAFAVV